MERFPNLEPTPTSRPWESEEFLLATSGQNKLGVSIGLDALVPGSFLESRFCIITHPSALPFNKASQQSFWSIMDGILEGASIHLMTRDLDEGPVLFQESLEVSIIMNSEELQSRQLDICVQPLTRNILNISLGNFDFTLQDLGSKHSKKEISKETALFAGETIEVEYLLRLCRTTCNKGNGFSIKTENGTFRISLSDVAYFE